jgi:hypothetical protein
MPDFILKDQQQLEFIKCFFTPEERAELSERLCRNLASCGEKEEEFKAVKLQFKQEIEGYRAEAARLARRLQFGYEHRHVVCQAILNSPVAGKKAIVRTDVPGELVRVQDMDDTEQKNAPAPPDKLFETAPEVKRESPQSDAVVSRGMANSNPTPDSATGAVDGGIGRDSPVAPAIPAVAVDANTSGAPAANNPHAATLALESSVEENARTRKTRKKLQGQDAILPDHRPNPQPGAPQA